LKPGLVIFFALKASFTSSFHHWVTFYRMSPHRVVFAYIPEQLMKLQLL